MAQQVTVQLVDDIDGSVASGTVDFALDGRNYSIDLSEKNAGALREALAPFIDAARRPGGRRKSAQPTPRPVANREYTTAVRVWANENGHQVAERGRIPSVVIAAYEQRNTAPAVAEKLKPNTAAAAKSKKTKRVPKSVADPFTKTG